MVTVWYCRLLPLSFYAGIVLGLLVGGPSIASAQQVSVPATFHRQEHALSCEIATLKMALGVHGLVVSESELIAQLPFDTTPKSRGVWGNPNQGFVGNIDGRMLVDGYGVYWDPIAKLGNHYATASVMRNGSPEQLARAITAGNPVIIWGYYGSRAAHSWQTPAGQPVHAVNGEHTRLVYGFDGPLTTPTRFYLLDPLSGPLTWSTAELMHNWSSLNHMGVVVEKHSRWVRVPGTSQVWELDHERNTRRWVTTWEVFTARGGTPTAVADIEQAKLQHYTLGEPIS